MGDRKPSTGPSSTRGVAKQNHHRRHGILEEVDRGDSIACTGKSCQSCTAGAIADCVAVCCCPCAVVNLLALAFVKLPWAVARRCVRRLKMKRNKRRIVEDERKWFQGDMDGILRKTMVPVEEEVRAGLEVEEEIWYEVGHLGFGRVSFTGVSNSNDEANLGTL
ncbi:hypothetical protein F511_01456 [Dorcoceras hygrometricum]|uniref:Uncharacterized protein n=1 Tax=Dorcoceras hygrometricum TaxID=472368 RepID=A0A2Z7BFQ1_9LAMI|nr:hypothetical protein F511_01456 [Dorcoceras hygrometricum]